MGMRVYWAIYPDRDRSRRTLVLVWTTCYTEREGAVSEMCAGGSVDMGAPCQLPVCLLSAAPGWLTAGGWLY